MGSTRSREGCGFLSAMLRQRHIIDSNRINNTQMNKKAAQKCAYYLCIRLDCGHAGCRWSADTRYPSLSWHSPAVPGISEKVKAAPEFPGAAFGPNEGDRCLACTIASAVSDPFIAAWVLRTALHIKPGTYEYLVNGGQPNYVRFRSCFGRHVDGAVMAI